MVSRVVGCDDTCGDGWVGVAVAAVFSTGQDADPASSAIRAKLSDFRFAVSVGSTTTAVVNLDSADSFGEANERIHP